MKLAALVLLCPTLAFAEQSESPQVKDRVASAAPGDASYETGAMAPGMVPVVVAPPKVVEEPTVAQAGIVGSGQGLYVGSALTTPANQVQISLTTVPPFGGIMTLSTGLGKTTEISASVGATIEDAEGLTGFGAGIKQVLGRGRGWQFALAGSIHQISEDGRDAETLYAMSAIASACGDENCGLLVSGGIHMIGISGEDEMATMVSLGLSAGSKTTRFLAELVAGGPGGEDTIGIGFLGVRIGGKKTAVDLGVAMLMGEGDDLPVVPVLNLHTRL